MQSPTGPPAESPDSAVQRQTNYLILRALEQRLDPHHFRDLISKVSQFLSLTHPRPKLNFPCLTTCCSAGFASLVLPAWLEGLVTVAKVACPTGSLPDEERLQCPDLSRWGLFLCSQGHILTDLGSHCYFAYILPCSKLAPRHSRQAARLESAHWGKRLTWGHLAVLFGAEWRRSGHRRVVDDGPRAHDSGHIGVFRSMIGPWCG